MQSVAQSGVSETPLLVDIRLIARVKHPNSITTVGSFWTSSSAPPLLEQVEESPNQFQVLENLVDESVGKASDANGSSTSLDPKLA